jgi:hypothetical protein
MKNNIILLLLLALTSCSSFERMKYRHIDKVPATPQTFTTSERLRACQEDHPLVPDTVGTQVQNAPEKQIDSCGIVPGNFTEQCPGEIVSPAHQNPITPTAYSTAGITPPIKRDWSLLIGALSLLCGILLLLMCIFVLPYAGIPLVGTIILELLFLYFVWRCIGTGMIYFITRFRKKRDFSEK